MVPEEPAVKMPMPVAPSRADVRAALAKRRAKNLASFRAYRKGGVYPHNTYRDGSLNVWRDAQGHLCAAATMIFKDGKEDLVKHVAETNNNVRLLDVTEGEVLDWMLTSGFTIEEIDRIQEPGFMDNVREQQQEQIAAEDKRLAGDYAKTDAWLVKHAKAGLDTATDRLMRNPWLARQLVAGDDVAPVAVFAKPPKA
jgi:hypothetical protein